MAGISADGTTLKPMLILQRDTLETELILRGYTVDEIHFARSENGYMTTHLFNAWAQHSFFPQLREKRQSRRYSVPILLILDGFGCHANEHFLAQCELENVIERAVLLVSQEGLILPLHLPPNLHSAGCPYGEHGENGTRPAMGSLQHRLDEMERAYIIEALTHFQGHLGHAAEALGLTERVMALRMKKYGITYKAFRPSAS